MTQDKVLLNAEELAKRLGMSWQSVLVMAREGRIPRIRISRNVVRFDWEEVMKALKKNQAK